MLIDILIIIFVLLGVRAILYGRNGIENCFIWIIWAFCLGYRTFETIPYVAFHPIEIFSFSCIIRLFTTKHYKYRSIPSIHKLNFVIFFLIFISGFYNFNIKSFVEFKSISLFYQFYFIAQYIKFDDLSFFKITRSYLIPAIYISIFGILEYSNPNITSTIFQIDVQKFNDPTAVLDFRLFDRLAFLFWGSHLAANIIPPIFSILIYLRYKKYGILNNNIFFLIIIFLFLIAIYLSGNRISWLIVTIIVLNIIFFYKSFIFPNVKKYSIAIVGIFIILVYSLPATQRYFSIFNAIILNIDPTLDASSSKRLELIISGLEIVKENFFGVGWGKILWIHNDIIQITAASGIIPGIIFIYSLIYLLLRVVRYYNFINNKLPNNSKHLILFICLNFVLHTFISLVFNGNYQLIQCGAPIFLLWVIADSYIDNSIKSKNTNINIIT